MFRRYRWFIGGLLFASTVINYLDRQTLSVLAPFVPGKYLARVEVRDEVSGAQLVREAAFEVKAPDGGARH